MKTPETKHCRLCRFIKASGTIIKELLIAMCISAGILMAIFGLSHEGARIALKSKAYDLGFTKGMHDGYNDVARTWYYQHTMTNIALSANTNIVLEDSHNLFIPAP